MEKGLAEALEACRHLPKSCHLNVFGPGMSDTDFALFEAPRPGHLPRHRGPRRNTTGAQRTRPAGVSELLQERGLPRRHPGSLPVRLARCRRSVGRRLGAGRARRERAFGGTAFGRRGRVRHQAAAERARVVPAALRGRETTRGAVSQRPVVRPCSCRTAQPVRGTYLTQSESETTASRTKRMLPLLWRRLEFARPRWS